MGDIHINKSQCGSPEVCLDCQNFCSAFGEYVWHPVGDRVIYESVKATTTTTTSERAIAADGGIAYELLEGGVHDEFGLLHTGDGKGNTAVLNAIAVELQKPASFKGRSRSSSALLGR